MDYRLIDEIHDRYMNILVIFMRNEIQGKLPFVPFCAKMSIWSKIRLFFQSTSDYESISLNQTASLFETASITNSSIVTNSFISNSECGHDVDVDVDDVEMSDIDVTDVSPDVPKRVSISNPIPRLNEIAGFRIGQLTNQR